MTENENDITRYSRAVRFDYDQDYEVLCTRPKQQYLHFQNFSFSDMQFPVVSSLTTMT